MSKNFFPLVWASNYTVKNNNNEPRPLRLIFYLKTSIAKDAADALLLNSNYYEVWDAICLLEDDFVLLNTKNVPMARAVLKERMDTKLIAILGQNVGLKLLVTIMESCPIPSIVNLIWPLVQIENWSLGITD